MEVELTDIAIGIDLLKDAGYSCIVVYFYGGGDSGSFEESHAIPREIVCDETGDLLVDRHSDEFADATKNAPEVPDPILNRLPSSYYQEHDWWNNEGGAGYIVVDFEKNYRFTHYDLNGEDQNEPEMDENGEYDWDNYEPDYAEWTEIECGPIEF